MASEEASAEVPIGVWATERAEQLREIGREFRAAGETRAARREALRQIGDLDGVPRAAAKRTLTGVLIDLSVESAAEQVAAAVASSSTEPVAGARDSTVTGRPSRPEPERRRGHTR